jgi:small subunit ribosomal protein S8
MTTSDPIADMLARIRNAQAVGHKVVSMPLSKIKMAIAKILKDEGYVEDYHMTDERPQPQLVIKLKYVGERKDRYPVITGMKRVSTPGCRVYTRAAEIPWVRSGLGVTILSTPKGVLTGQQAHRLGVGGEVLCYVW